jgi:hypothetical protein
MEWGWGFILWGTITFTVFVILSGFCKLFRIRVTTPSLAGMTAVVVWFLLPFSTRTSVVLVSSTTVTLGYLVERGPEAYPRFMRKHFWPLSEFWGVEDRLTSLLFGGDFFFRYAVPLFLTSTSFYATVYYQLWREDFPSGTLVFLGGVGLGSGVSLGVLLKKRAFERQSRGR